MSEWKKARKRDIDISFREVEPLTQLYKNAYTGELSKVCKGPEWFPVEGEVICTLEGEDYATPENDFIICGVHGELYPLKKYIFNETYKVVE